MAVCDREEQFKMKTVILRYAFVVVTNIYSQEKKRKNKTNKFNVNASGARAVLFRLVSFSILFFKWSKRRIGFSEAEILFMYFAIM